MAVSDKLKSHLEGYLKEMSEKEMRLALQAMKQEQKRRKRKKKRKNSKK